MSTPQAGWYLDPSAPHQLRYWDGTTWTAHVGPLPVTSAPPVATVPATRRGLPWQAIVGIVAGSLVLFAGSLVAFVAMLSANHEDLEAETSAHVDAAMLGTLVSSYLEDAPETTSVDVVQRGGHYVLEDAGTTYDLGQSSSGVVLGDFTHDGEQWCLWVQADNGTAVEFRSTSGPVEGRCLLTDPPPEAAAAVESEDMHEAAEKDVLALADLVEQWYAGIPLANESRERYPPPVVWQEGSRYLINPEMWWAFPNPHYTDTIELPASEGVSFLDESGLGSEGWCVAVVTDGGYELRYSASGGLAEGGCLS